VGKLRFYEYNQVNLTRSGGVDDIQSTIVQSYQKKKIAALPQGAIKAVWTKILPHLSQTHYSAWKYGVGIVASPVIFTYPDWMFGFIPALTTMWQAEATSTISRHVPQGE
jgi:hypothetical protein